MSVRTETIHFLGCDGCGVEFHDRTARSATGVRIAAGRDGWKYKCATPRATEEAKRRQWDLCPQCPFPDVAS